jgi:hypothetical protein
MPSVFNLIASLNRFISSPPQALEEQKMLFSFEKIIIGLFAEISNIGNKLTAMPR